MVNAFATSLGCHHPSIWTYIDAVKDEQAITDIKASRYLMKYDPEPRKPASIKRDEQLMKIVKSYYDFGSTVDFLNCIASSRND